MTSQPWMLALCCISVVAVLGTGELVTTTEMQKFTCRTFGSGVVQPFSGSSYYLRSTCRVTLSHFTHNRVDCDISTRRGDNGLLVQVEITINKVQTVLMNGSILVEKKSVSLPYDHTYQHVFQYGIYTRLRSMLLPLTVTWHDVPGGIDTLWVEMEQEMTADMSGLCGKHNVAGNKQQLITDAVHTEEKCQTRDTIHVHNAKCRELISYVLDCLKSATSQYIQLCEENVYLFEESSYVSCAFFKEVVRQCGNDSHVWSRWRGVTRCAEPSCPGDLSYVEEGSAFVPSCSNPKTADQDLTNSCVCPDDQVLNDHAGGFQCINVSSCPCVFADLIYSPGDIRSTKCQSCVCDGGKWHCSDNYCPSRCLIEGPYVTTYDGKEYVVPGRCKYVASQGQNWSLTIEFSEKGAFVKAVALKLFQEKYTFTHNMVHFGEEEIRELHQSDHATVFWQSSTYVHVSTSFGMEMQVQMSPEIQLYISAPEDSTDTILGLCGNSNSDTKDDFTSSSVIIENSAQMVAQSWSVGHCEQVMDRCINTDNEIFADEKCSVLNDPSGVFAKCHGYVASDRYHKACIQRTCNCATTVTSLQQCLCVALASYAKVCADLGMAVGDWRHTTNCIQTCETNQEFSYDTRACNRTCSSLSAPDPRCGQGDGPVDGCGCPEGTHLNDRRSCTPKAECTCHSPDTIIPPGPAVIDGRQCICEDGALNCSKDCGCSNGKICVHCSEQQVKTTQKTCDSLSKPLVGQQTCVSGCYCPHNQYEDHTGKCVSLDNCTCMYSGQVFSVGHTVKTNCKTCTCNRGQWQCVDEPCTEKCQLFGNGHIQTFDSKWYRFDGHCQYTLVEDDCGTGNWTFSVRVERVPCCDEALTCSRTVTLELKDEVTLTLSDTGVSRYLYKASSLLESSLYTTHTVGLYVVILVPSRDMTLIWDKHTRITVELASTWRSRVCGLCGNLDSNEMNDLETHSAAGKSPLAFGNSWKTATHPCSDVTTDVFPCEHNSYCLAWAQRRCMILTGDTFRDCHLKVDPEPYYHSCVEESCSCEFEGKFLGFCTAVAAYAEACSDKDVCVKWRTPDLCPVYCDYYNEQDQCTWHYEACGQAQTCGKGNHFSLKLEGCYPRCPADAPYYDENRGECTQLRSCTCYFNNTVIQSQSVVMIQKNECVCVNGTIKCETSWTDQTSRDTTNTEPTAIPNRTTTSVPPTTLQPTNSQSATTPVGECVDLRRNKRWIFGETWTEDCFHKKCTDGKIEMTPVVCPETEIPICPRGKAVKISDGCCETWTCDCVCDIYGDPHYISFTGVPFDFLDECTYTLVEETWPRHHLTVAVDNFDCNLHGSCAKGIILHYNNNTARLTVMPGESAVRATLNTLTIEPPYEEHGFRFETTEYVVSVYLPQVRSYVSLTPYYTVVVNLAMEHFLMNTQGQCGVCGGESCIRTGGQIENDDCCDETAYDWVYTDPIKPACAPKNIPCNPWPTPSPTTPCQENWLCQLLDHPVFDSCSQLVDLQLLKKNCEFDSCRHTDFACSSLEQAARQCQDAGICIEWRKLTNGSCEIKCPKELVHSECHSKLDDFCCILYNAFCILLLLCLCRVLYPGSALKSNSAGCFCPEGQFRAGNHSDICVMDCLFCKGPLGEPRLPGEEWQSNCYLCTCNNQTRTEECHPKPITKAICGPNDELVTRCCGDQTCGKLTQIILLLIHLGCSP
ncbi:mucin-19 [Dunckerocampus dactyliophorus]|uniref:mucin-19 n=1 Tax=Dunckerocampus dactyliophorus TaxID=161453 RepID=UPI002407406A|nr:mucin-19 [Dunckerocampus dactyliophorus]